MELKPGYKETDVGVIPEDWDTIPTDSVVEPNAPICYGVVQVGQDTNGGVPIVAIKYVKDIGSAPLHRTSIAFEQPYSRSRVKGGDVLISIKGTIGRVGIVPEGFNGNISRELARLRIREEYSSEYIAHQLESDKTQVRISKSVVGTTRLEFSIATLRRFELPTPSSLSEQRAIATALSNVDALLDGLDRLIAKKRDLKQAAMQQLLTGETRLPGFEGEWELKTIGDLSQVGRGRVISHAEISKSSSQSYPVFSSQTSNHGIMGYLDTYDFEGDYVTWTTDGANAGTVFARSGRFNCTNVCGTIKLHNSDHHFVAAALGRVSQPHVSRHLGNPKLMNDVMKKIEVIIPKTRTEQTAIATVLSDMDAEIAALEQRRNKTKDIKQAMMQELLTGKTRLVTPGGFNA
jgi:type I restriction enzyme, S subunit